MERRLAAILSADVVGYSRLMGEDEPGTLAALKAQRADLINPKVAQYNGRIIKLMGDGTLIEFPSVLDAVQFAIEVQYHLREQQAQTAENRPLILRIGINLGDVIIDGDDVYGDGVNLAARLEQLAEPGGICVRRAVRNQVRDKLDVTFIDKGEIEVKNIARPVRVFSIALDEKVEALITPIGGLTGDRRPNGGWRSIAAAAVLVLVPLLALLVWQPWTETRIEPSATAKVGAALPLPSKPSIAIMSFNNLSGDPAQDYFADAIAESISSGLSRFIGLFVVSKDATLVYKGKSVTVGQIGRELGVRYLLEGSVQKGKERLRVSARLTDTIENKLVWANTYDEPLTDILVVQDRIMEQVSSTLGETIWQDAARKLESKPLKDFTAYDYTLKGLDHLHRLTQQDNLLARKLFMQSREIDPDIFLTAIGLGWTWFLEWRFGWSPAPDALDKAVREAKRAAKIEPMNGEPYRLLGRVNLQWRNFDQVLALSSRAVKLSPNNSDIVATHALNLNYLGLSKEGIQWGLKAIRLNPNHPIWYPNVVADGYYLDGQYDKAIKTLQGNSDFWIRDRWVLAAAYIQLSGKVEAAKHVAAILKADPKFNLRRFKARQPFRKMSDLMHYVDALRKAGIPE